MPIVSRAHGPVSSVPGTFPGRVGTIGSGARADWPAKLAQSVKVTAAQDGTSLMRAEIAHGKAYGALALGMGSRALFQRAQEQGFFVSAVNTLAQGRLVPVPGGVLIQNGSTLLGAVGVSGDTSDNDEICAIAGIEAAGLKANPG